MEPLTVTLLFAQGRALGKFTASPPSSAPWCALLPQHPGSPGRSGIPISPGTLALQRPWPLQHPGLPCLPCVCPQYLQPPQHRCPHGSWGTGAQQGPASPMATARPRPAQSKELTDHFPVSWGHLSHFTPHPLAQQLTLQEPCPKLPDPLWLARRVPQDNVPGSQRRSSLPLTHAGLSMAPGGSCFTPQVSPFAWTSADPRPPATVMISPSVTSAPGPALKGTPGLEAAPGLGRSMHFPETAAGAPTLQPSEASSSPSPCP